MTDFKSTFPSPISLQTRKEWFSANETKIKRFWNATAEVRNAKTLDESFLGYFRPRISVCFSLIFLALPLKIRASFKCKLIQQLCWLQQNDAIFHGTTSSFLSFFLRCLNFWRHNYIVWIPSSHKWTGACFDWLFLTPHFLPIVFSLGKAAEIIINLSLLSPNNFRLI